MAKLAFTKMHGAGNDFVFVDGVRAALPDLTRIAARLCDRHFGIGCDQLLAVLPSQVADFRMRIWNAAGTEVEMCGNGIRCLFKYVRSRGYTTKDEIAVETSGGIVRPRADGDLVRVDMGEPILDPARIPTTIPAQPGRPGGPIVLAPFPLDEKEFRVTLVSMGNPHCVVVVDDPRTFPVTEIGPRIQRDPRFPRETNVEFVKPEGRARIVQRTWERGSGETLACGSGACAAAVACHLNGLTDREVEVVLSGGTLRIAWSERDNRVYMSGPAEEVFTGEIEVGE
jgi:diaminopimelate epimerase